MRLNGVSKTLVKLLLWVLLSCVALVASWFVLNGIGDLLAYFQQGADPASALNIIPNVPLDLHVTLNWLPDDPDTGREMEPFTRTQLESTYLRAWLQWNISFLRDEPYGLKTYFVGPALEAASEAVNQDWHITQQDITHNLQLHFYSADGSIVSFTDHDTRVSQMVYDLSGNIVFAGETEGDYDVVMFLEDGTWRVRHWVRTDGTTLGAGDMPTAPVADDALPPAGFVARDGAALILDGQPYQIAGVNYYPQETPWDDFWLEYDPLVIESDFDLIRSLGLNAIRTFIPYEQFGGPNIDPDMLENLTDLLEQAGEHDLKVIVTLFDFRVDYNQLLWPHADRHLEALLTEFADNPTILAWDLKNEPNSDYDAAGREVVNAWLAHTARLAHEYAPNHLITIGWLSPQAAQSLTEYVDLISFHYYGLASELSASCDALRAVAPDHPIALTEFGLPTWNSFFFPHGHSEPEQTEYYADILTALRESGGAGYLAWTLYDFEHVPSSVTGRFPWQKGPQKNLGLIRVDGEPKAAAALLAPDASLEVIHVPEWSRFLKPFWLTVMISALLGLLVLIKGVSYWYKSRYSQK